MALNPITASRRIKAAREAIGLDQEDVGSRFVSYGFGKHDVGKIERMDPTAPQLTQGRIDALVKITGFPPEWFTEPDLQAVFNKAGPTEVDQLRAEWKADLVRAKQERAEELRPLEARLSQLERGEPAGRSPRS